MTVFAQVKINSGNNDFLKEEATAVVVFDYSDASWEEGETYEHWCGEDYAERVDLSYGSFRLGFNKESSKLKIKQDDPSAKYRIIVKITNMEQHMSGWGRFYAACSGTITVEEIATEESICNALFKEVDGDADYVPNDRLAKCFNALGKATAKMK